VEVINGINFNGKRRFKMFGLGFQEFIIILMFFFLPSFVTGTLAKRKGRRFWIWTTFGCLICLFGGYAFGMLLVVFRVVEPMPFFHLYVGALVGPLVALLIKPLKQKSKILIAR
jgi:uncharacterized membrane protein